MSEKVSGTGGVSLDMPILYLKAQQSGIVCIDQHSTFCHICTWHSKSPLQTLERSEVPHHIFATKRIVVQGASLPCDCQTSWANCQSRKVTWQANYRRSAWSFGGLIMLNLCKRGPIWYTVAGESNVMGCHAQTIRCIGTSRPETTIKMGCWDADVCYADAKVQPGFPQGLLLAVPISKTTHPKLQTSAILP